MIDLVVRNATVLDGSGSPPFVGDVAVVGGRVELVGDAGGVEAALEIDATGKAVSPGFIDVHSHADFPIYVDGLSQSGIRQGLTTLVTGTAATDPRRRWTGSSPRSSRSDTTRTGASTWPGPRSKGTSKPCSPRASR